ncbi:MAG TPA: M56 family metallopeptidase [Allosphingosinicella sp.]|nr:M56 family metallopeptidase [Allosphingosinicella sp.]
MLLLALTAGLAALCRNRPPALRHAIWVAGLAGLVIMLPLSGLLPRLHLGLVAGGRAGLGPNLLLLAWLLPASLLLLAMVRNRIALGRMRRSAVPVSDPAILALAADIASQLGIRRSVDLVRHADPVPRTFGTLRPVILLPFGSDQWSRERLRMTLLHELAHVARLDAATGGLARFAAAFHWFNPLAWLSLRALGDLAERACDARVLANGAEPGAYARLLLETAREAAMGRPGWRGAAAMTDAENLEGRLRLILGRASREDRPRPVQLAAVTALAALVTLGLAPLRGEAPTHYGRLPAQAASSVFSSE